MRIECWVAEPIRQEPCSALGPRPRVIIEVVAHHHSEPKARNPCPPDLRLRLLLTGGRTDIAPRRIPAQALAVATAIISPQPPAAYATSPRQMVARTARGLRRIERKSAHCVRQRQPDHLPQVAQRLVHREHAAGDRPVLEPRHTVHHPRWRAYLRRMLPQGIVRRGYQSVSSLWHDPPKGASSLGLVVEQLDLSGSGPPSST